MKLLNVSGNTKINKSDKFGGYLTAILHLAPANLSGHQVCPWATAGCRQACLNTAGRGKFNSVQAGRIRKTKMFFEQREEFLKLLVSDIEALCRKCEREGVKPVVRLNGTSDILWERIPVKGERNIFKLFPNVEFYDYTKAPPSKRRLEKNYSLVYSRADDSQKQELTQALSQGGKVAVVFEGELPEFYWGFPVVNGDQHDLRFLDPQGCIIGLSAKGQAKFDYSGFVVRKAPSPLLNIVS